MNGDTVLSATMLAYDVTDASNIYQLNYYSSGAININITLGLAPYTPYSNTESLSAEAKAGIAVGSIVGTVAIFSARSLLYRKKSKEHMQPVMDEKKELSWNNIERQYFELVAPSTTAVAEPLYRNSADQQVLSSYANPGSTYNISKSIEKLQTSNVLAISMTESLAQTLNGSVTHKEQDILQKSNVQATHIEGDSSQTPDAVTKQP
ncbi:uncharacterized protein RHIMIDRAFT_289689 [Rhizopus microsporus ATCC 52813]|uniref:Uncharacterized protein n=1 Tax=Rhizopus microsporus ATCC 52813 TaxID=1340429 RepID=A0A2G4T2I7_RHIZD|nr:uncharacterized protein RHIMIDRAFT_289689 [Rhizopus microsporus ATCC 52813]PHZ15229.1 hypothetical protein RHIMIDRAFT_289689 [Rhizopus microsporus ATCC 52813]